MLPLATGREASTGAGAPQYVRHHPERTLLYQLVAEHYPALKAQLTSQGVEFPGYVEQEFEDYLKCDRFEHGFLRLRCETCHAEQLIAFSCCPQLEAMKSPVPRVRRSRDSSRDSLPIVSHR